MNATPSTGERKQVSPDFSASRNSKPPHETPKQVASSPETAKPASSYGIFSSAKAVIPGKQGSVADDSAGNSSLPGSKSDGGVDQGGQKGFGIFSRGRPN
jgi:translation initiation factor IF-3